MESTRQNFSLLLYDTHTHRKWRRNTVMTYLYHASLFRKNNPTPQASHIPRFVAHTLLYDRTSKESLVPMFQYTAKIQPCMIRSSLILIIIMDLCTSSYDLAMCRLVFWWQLFCKLVYIIIRSFNISIFGIFFSHSLFLPLRL